MKLILLIFLIFPVIAQSPVPPVAVARLCGNTVIEGKFKKQWKQRIEREGCSEVHFVPLEDDYYLAYGVKILTGESVSR